MDGGKRVWSEGGFLSVGGGKLFCGRLGGYVLNDNLSVFFFSRLLLPQMLLYILWCVEITKADIMVAKFCKKKKKKKKKSFYKM